MSHCSELNQKIKNHVKGHWLHNFEIDEAGNIASQDSFANRRSCLEQVFASLFLNSSVMVLDEMCGVYPVLIHRAGARKVTACNANQSTCDLIGEVLQHLRVSATVVKSTMMAFYDSEPYVEKEYGESHDFMLALNQIWPLFVASGENFDAIVEACTFFVTDGLVFDWSDAKWASPPASYNKDQFCKALQKKFQFVICSDWLVAAVGKLPIQQEAPPENLTGGTEIDHSCTTGVTQFHNEFREAICRAVPQGAVVAVVSKGDPELLNLERRTGWHFPQGVDGIYLGHHPVDSGAAISHVEELREKGAEFLAFPKPAFWWLDYYREFQEHLETRYSRLMHLEEACIIFGLQPVANVTLSGTDEEFNIANSVPK